MPKSCPLGDHPKGGCTCLAADRLKEQARRWDIDSVKTAFNAANREGRSNAAAILHDVLLEKSTSTEIKKSDE